MPKERTHWHLAHRAAAALPAGPLADAVLAYPDHLYLGAVTHDTGYYPRGNPAAAAAADRAHGSGGRDPYAGFRALAAGRWDWGAPGLALGFGALTHLAADVTFHPLVFSWTGDAQAPDDLGPGWLYRHQACETALDLHLEDLWGPAPAKTYRSLLVGAGSGTVALVSAFLGAPAGPWMLAHARLQGLFHRRLVGHLARLLAWRAPEGDGDWSAAFYQGSATAHPAFVGELAWVDPVSGQEATATLDALVDRAVSLALDLGARWEAAWTSGAEAFEGEIGPALDTGVRADLPQEKRYFLPRWF